MGASRGAVSNLRSALEPNLRATFLHRYNDLSLIISIAGTHTFYILCFRDHHIFVKQDYCRSTDLLVSMDGSLPFRSYLGLGSLIDIYSEEWLADDSESEEVRAQLLLTVASLSLACVCTLLL